MTKDELTQALYLFRDLWCQNIDISTIDEFIDDYAQQQVRNLNIPDVGSRFSIVKTILSDFALFAIVDNELNKVVCHLVYDNGEVYCEEMANKMLAGLNCH